MSEGGEQPRQGSYLHSVWSEGRYGLGRCSANDLCASSLWANVYSTPCSCVFHVMKDARRRAETGTRTDRSSQATLVPQVHREPSCCSHCRHAKPSTTLQSSMVLMPLDRNKKKQQQQQQYNTTTFWSRHAAIISRFLTELAASLPSTPPARR